MRHLIPALILLLGVFVSNTTATDYRGTCDISFEARATMKKINGTASCEPFDISDIGSGTIVPVLSVPVSGIKTGNFMRDRDMRKMFDSENHPLIYGMAGPNPGVHVGDLIQGRIHPPEEVSFQLRIRSVVQPVTALVSQFDIENHQISTVIAFEVSLSAFDLKPPSFLGMIKVADIVRVTVRLTLQPVDSTTASPVTKNFGKRPAHQQG